MIDQASDMTVPVCNNKVPICPIFVHDEHSLQVDEMADNGFFGNAVSHRDLLTHKETPSDIEGKTGEAS